MQDRTEHPNQQSKQNITALIDNQKEDNIIDIIENTKSKPKFSFTLKSSCQSLSSILIVVGHVIKSALSAFCSLLSITSSVLCIISMIILAALAICLVLGLVFYKSISNKILNDFIL